MNRLDFLIDYLIKEDPQYSEMRIPEDLQGKRDLFRALRNVREPKPVSEEFLRLQDVHHTNYNVDLLYQL